jgi:hypothetical protein
MRPARIARRDLKRLLSRLTMDRQHILEEIRRTAADNGGLALGRARFAQATGILEAHWRGTHWARWADAVQEAGLDPPPGAALADTDAVLAQLAALVRRLGRFPTLAELRAERGNDPAFPSGGAFERLGSKVELIDRLRAFCRTHPDHADVPGILDFSQRAARAAADAPAEEAADGYVFLLQSGKHFAFGCTPSRERGAFETAQAAQGVKVVHGVRSDDPEGIRTYWQQRFAAGKTRGDWFVLSAEDVAAFKRRKFM